MEYQHKITVFTPTYNRAYILETLYRSLRRQTYRDFEWLVVDDGSSDNTRELVAAWQQEETPFPIRYVYKENGGKCQAINLGLQEAKGLLFFNVDSDDYLTDDALEKIAAWEEALPKGEKFCAVAGNLGTAPDVTPNKPLPGPYFDGTAFDRYGTVEGERALAFYTEVARKYPYPACPGEKFMTEAVTWNRMAADGWRIRYYNDIIWIYEYKPDGLTNAGYRLFQENPQGTGIFFREKAKFLHYTPFAYLGMWYGFATENFGRCTDAQIADYIQMPRWLIPPVHVLDAAVKFIKKR